MQRLTGILIALLLALLPVSGVPTGIFATPAIAQETAPATPDFAAWEKTASEIESEVADPEITDQQLDERRAQLVPLRAEFQTAQGANSGRIETLRGQLAALGAPPEDGTTEAPEITARRTELQTQISEAEAPGKAAVEAYTRADNLIKQIDAILRDRQTNALLELSPSPLNPANWTLAAAALLDAGKGIAAEINRHVASDVRRQNLISNLPIILLHLVIAAVILLRGRAVMERLVRNISGRSSLRGAKVIAKLVSLGQVVLPVLGVVLVSRALQLSGMVGVRTSPIVETLPWAGFLVFAALWLAGRLFPDDAGDSQFQLAPERRREARVHIVAFGILLAIRSLLEQIVPNPEPPVYSVLAFPLLVVGGILLFRFGQLLRTHAVNATAANTEVLFRHRLITYVAYVTIAIGALAPLLAAVGYVSAATALIYPAAMTLALIGMVMFLQGLCADIYVLAIKGDEANRGDLVPVLLGFVLCALAVPFLLLIWGARGSDLAEMWIKFREGFNIAGVQVSPTIFLTFVVVFVLGYTVTKLLQGALGASILPKTKLDTGGQRAVVLGVGYVGVVLSAIIAMTAAGINLSSLAILASALSVGIGFGLQNIVQNFVSGIILLIERPVSEGDWIEVAGVQGRVRAISVRSTRIETFDRNHVIVPNASLISGQVTNITRFNLSGRVLQQVTVSGVNDSDHVQKVLEDIAKVPPMVILNPPPSVGLIGIDGGNLTFEMRLIIRDVNFRGEVQDEVLHLIHRRFKEENIVFGIMGSSKTIMADGDGVPYVLPGAIFGDKPPADPVDAEAARDGKAEEQAEENDQRRAGSPTR